MSARRAWHRFSSQDLCRHDDLPSKCFERRPGNIHLKLKRGSNQSSYPEAFVELIIVFVQLVMAQANNIAPERLPRLGGKGIRFTGDASHHSLERGNPVFYNMFQPLAVTGMMLMLQITPAGAPGAAGHHIQAE
jgi:hypothetical protein